MKGFDMGIFITMEGPDGAGKSTQIDLLRGYLLERGYDIIVCREPGGTVISEAIREVILNKDYKNMGHMTELLLYAAARAQLVEEVIQPALEEGKVVICDRFIESSAVYQGIARGMGIDLVYEINQFAVGSTMPDITILLDIDAETGIGRKKKQAELDRMESEKLEFHKKVVEGYRLLAERDKNRMVKIDGRNSIEEIHRQIKGAVNNTLLRDGRGCDEEF
ncbi:Thymidylate kinase [Anaerostipes rhamnosivorans]|jgi:dTMP kinase|uniref:Thymidylate kinase n=2 Tax=Anaerostipes rhamnosivorans TaxID=1229621 RepID=A0A4P8I7V9_9FIRM|nr:dTMP kinase [uncultured Anaerostipes sp.]QCP33538.1 Thymidylate kinase [Anaerostipes rhamnosivorans]